MRVCVLALAIVANAGAAAAEVNLSVSLDAEAGLVTQAYECDDGKSFSVQYVNSASNSLAILPVEEDDIVFVNVVAASGAKYVSGIYTWWTKGDEATLSKEIGEDAPVNCVAQVAK